MDTHTFSQRNIMWWSELFVPNFSPPILFAAHNHQSMSRSPPESPSQFDIDKFNCDGYYVIPNFLSLETVALLLQRVVQLLNEFSLEGHPMTKFSTGEREPHVGDEVDPSSWFN